MRKTTIEQTQQHLENAIRQVFPDAHIVTNARRTAKIVSPFTGRFLELDLWLPDLKLAFEFQDPHHYTTTTYSHSPVGTTKTKDTLKKHAVDERGETLITIPFWWDGDVQSLVATIRAQRPDLCTTFHPEAKPISHVPPPDFLKVSNVPDVGGLMLASVADAYLFNPSTWWIGEKYDGIRACWNVDKKTLYTRFGRELFFIPSFSTWMPSFFADGEVWLGRGHIHSLQRLAQLETDSENADQAEVFEFLRFVVFDNADPLAHNVPFEERFSDALNFVDPSHPFIIPASSQKCIDKLHVKYATETIFENGGEGVIIRKKASPYIPGRSDVLYKFKAFKDQEGLVISIESGEYWIQLPNGVVCRSSLNQHYYKEHVNTADISKDETIKSDLGPEVGDIVTFSYSGFSPEGVPMDVKVHNVRVDMKWPDVVSAFYSDVPIQRYPDAYTQTVFASISATRQPHGHWTGDGHNVKQFFDELAHKRKVDPEDARSWADITQKDIINQPGGKSILYHYNGSVRKALAHVYPNLGLDDSTFTKIPRNFWLSADNRREFFDTLAKRKRFDWRVPTNWYSLKRSHVLNEKGGVSILSYYKGSLASALVDIYPDIGLDQALFGVTPEENRWVPPKERRAFFDSFAFKKRFDPLVPYNWYSITPIDILADKEGLAVLNQYEGELSAGLMDVYPNIGLEKMKFNPEASSTTKMRHFFDQLARDLQFDPLIPTNWYLLQTHHISSTKDGEKILEKYDGNVAKALVSAYPEIGLEENSINNLFTNKFWLNQASRREYMMLYAKKKAFDPLSPVEWHRVKREEFFAEKGGYELLQYCYSKSLPRAIKHVFPEIRYKSNL